VVATRSSRGLQVVVLVAAAIVLAGCAAGPNPATDGPDAAGFWLGLWQGFISPVTFVVSLFTDEVSIYEVRNNGNWYDAGFMLGVCMVFSGGAGSGSAARPRRKDRRS
jgi:hypothetical protein